jgi:hypothetical protein
MVAGHLQLSCFAMLASCHLFSVQPEISPCTALENRVLHKMSCTRRKRKEKNITIRLSKQKLLKINSRIKLSKKKKLWKINPIDKKLHHFEDGVDNQSVCSQVLVRQISQLANAASADSTDENYCQCLLLHRLFQQSSQLSSRPCNPHICMSLHMHQCKSLLVIWRWRRKRRGQCKALTSRDRSMNACVFLTLFSVLYNKGKSDIRGNCRLHCTG